LHYHQRPLILSGDADGVKIDIMQKIEHIGIAVKNLEESNQRFAQLLNTIHYKTEELPSEGVMTSFFEVGDVKIELLQATNESSPIHKFIESKGEGIHHIAFAVDDVNTELQRLKEAGFDAIHDTPKPGADNKVIAFLHPKSTQGVLTEICADQP
jgi:methylmalonyl-CoA/ethylmalonyl-CoA epimerase